MDFITVDGERVQVPDGTPDSALPTIAARHRAKKDMAGRDPFTRAAFGFAAPMAEVAQGIKQLVQGDRFDPSTIEQVRGAREGAGTAGTVGEVASFALPGGVSSKVIGKVATKALPRALAAAGLSGAEQGLYEGARATTGDESRLGNAAQGAAWGGFGGGLGHALPSALSRVARPVVASAPVQAVVDQFRRAGIDPRLTLGQALNGSVAKAEEALAAFPGTSVRPARERAVEEWNRAQLVNASRGARDTLEERARDFFSPDEVARLGQPALDKSAVRAGHKGVAAVQAQVGRLYDDALEGVQVRIADASPFGGTDALLPRLVTDDAEAIARRRDNLLVDMRRGLSGEKAKQFDSELRQSAERAYREGNYELGRAWEQLRDEYMGVVASAMSDAQRAALGQADQLYARLLPLQNAAAMQGSLARGGVFTPSQQLSQIRATNPKSVVGRGGARGQADAEAAQQVFGGTIPEVGPGTAEKLLGSVVTGGAGALAADALLTGDVDLKSGALFLSPVLAAALLTRPGVARAAIGETDWQRAMQRSPLWAATQARIEALRGPTRAAAARLAAQYGAE